MQHAETFAFKGFDHRIGGALLEHAKLSLDAGAIAHRFQCGDAAGIDAHQGDLVGMLSPDLGVGRTGAGDGIGGCQAKQSGDPSCVLHISPPLARPAKRAPRGPF